MKNPSIQIHSSSDVEEGVQIGVGTSIWHFSHICQGATIGEGCNIGQNVFIGRDVVIGNRVKIQNNVSVYTGSVLEDEVFLGPSCVLTNVTNPRSQIQRHSLLEKTVIRRGATVGANATLVCGIELGRYSFIAAGCVVSEDVKEYALMMGVPGRQKGWMSRHGHRLNFTDSQKISKCLESGFRYRLDDEGLVKCLDLDEESPLPESMQVGEHSYDSYKEG